MTDHEYLERTVKIVLFCLKCEEGELEMRGGKAVCPNCDVEYSTFKEFYFGMCKDLGWNSEDSWKGWFERHPDYKEKRMSDDVRLDCSDMDRATDYNIRAAAPELLKALRNLVKAYDRNLGRTSLQVRIACARKAIDKAEEGNR